MEDIRDYFKKLISSGVIKASIGGPRDNILLCDTLSDWCVASGELVKAGYSVLSPGGFGGASSSERANTHNKIWRSGTLCASVIKKKVLIFSMPHNESDYCNVISDSKD